MSDKNDRIFQLSLTEIAFTLIFLLLLLLGYMLFSQEKVIREAEAALAQIASAEEAKSDMAEVNTSLKIALENAGAANPDDVISNLVSKKELLRENEDLKAQIENLDAKLSSLVEVKAALEKADGADKDKELQKKIQEALALKSALENKLSKEVVQDHDKLVSQLVSATQLAGNIDKEMREQLGSPVQKGKEAQLAKDLVGSYKQLASSPDTSDLPQLRKDNTDLRGQLVFLKGKLEARGGRDYPPCWANEKTGKVEFLFKIISTPDGFIITPRWPQHRVEDAMNLPSLNQLVQPGSRSLSEFVSLTQGILSESNAKSCRHYVVLGTTINDRVTADKYRLTAEGVFYKIEGGSRSN